MAVSFSVFCTFLLLAASPLLASTQYSCVTTWMVDQDAGTDCRGLSLDNQDRWSCLSLVTRFTDSTAARMPRPQEAAACLIIRPGQYNLLRKLSNSYPKCCFKGRVTSTLSGVAIKGYSYKKTTVGIW